MCSESSLTFAFNLKAAIVSPSEAQQFTAVSPAAFISPILAPRANSNTLTAYWSCLAAICLKEKKKLKYYVIKIYPLLKLIQTADEHFLVS